jgi:hypothetical protein
MSKRWEDRRAARITGVVFVMAVDSGDLTEGGKMARTPRPVYTDHDKRTTLEDLAARVADGALVAVGGGLCSTPIIWRGSAAKRPASVFPLGATVPKPGNGSTWMRRWHDDKPPFWRSGNG